jgi:N-acetylmuramoyl-L-alanine amidase
MTLDIDRSHSSPNHSSRNGQPITLIVGHATVGPYLSSLNWLCNPNSRVSSHYLVRKDGHIAQLVADARAAWHAGASFWNDLDSEEIQAGSLGIELENLTGMEMPNKTTHPPDPYPAVQIAAFRALVQAKMTEYHIPLSHVVRHLDIAIPRGRKTDPANFDWATFKQSLMVNAPGTYRVRGAAVHQGPGLNFPIALNGTAFLPSGAVVEIDEVKPEWGGIGHMKNGLGFALLEQLEHL